MFPFMNIVRIVHSCHQCRYMYLCELLYIFPVIKFQNVADDNIEAEF